VIVYEATKQQFLHDSDNDDIEDVILAHYTAKTGKGVGRSEVASWKGSLGYMAKVLRDEAVPNDTGLAIELHLPQSSKRIVFTLTHAGNLTPDKIVIFKWEDQPACCADEGSDGVSTATVTARHSSGPALMRITWTQPARPASLANQSACYLNTFQQTSRAEMTGLRPTSLSTQACHPI
jgi:hypothetical protein